MGLRFTEQILPFAGAALVLSLLLHVAWNNRRDPVARWFAVTLTAIIVWAIGYCFEIMATGLQGKILFADLQFLGVATVSVSWWEMTRRYLGMRRIPKAFTGALWLVSGVTVLVALLNPWNIFRGVPSIVAGQASLALLHADYGPWYWWVLIPQVTLLNAVVLILLARAAVRAKRLMRRQYSLLFVALLLPLIASAIYVIGLPPLEDYNLTVAVLGISGLLLGMGLFRWRLFNIIPLAHDRVIENLTDGVIVVDRGGRIVDLNRSAERIAGVDGRSVTGQSAADVLSAYPVLVEMLSSPDSDAPNTTARRDMLIKREEASTYFAISSSPVCSRRGDPLGTAVIMHDITERVRLFEQTRELANKDDLTGLPNRRHFFELAGKEFDRAQRYSKPVSLLVFDVDYFKKINDTYGHRTGDGVLCDLAEACRGTLRTSDTIGRIGGEEFAVLLPETGLKVAMEVADRLRRAAESVEVSSGVDSEEEVPAVTISVGAAQLQLSIAATDTFDSVLERADRALYRAKDLGRNLSVASEEPPGLRAVV